MAAGLVAFHVIYVVHSIVMENINLVFFGVQALFRKRYTAPCYHLLVCFWAPVNILKLASLYSFKMTLGDCLSALKTGDVSYIYNHGAMMRRCAIVIISVMCILIIRMNVMGGQLPEFTT